MNQRRHRRSILTTSAYERKNRPLIARATRDEKRKYEPPFDEVRVHACLALIRHIIETFLVDEALPLGGGSLLWQQLLSPDLVTHEGRLSLLDIEMNLKHRRISRQRNSVSADGGNAPGSSGSTYSSGRNSSSSVASAAGMRSPNPKLTSPVSSNSLVSAPPSVSRGPNNKSLPRNWGKSYAGGGQRRTSTSLGSESKSGSSASTTTQVTAASSLTSQGADEEYTGDYEMNIRYLHRIIAVTMLRSLRTAVDQFKWVIRLIEVPFDCNGNSKRGDLQMQQPESVVTVDQAYALLGSLTDLLFLLINRANAIETLYSNIDGDIEEDAEEDEDDPEDKDQCFLTDLFQYLQVFVVRFQKALFACRIADLPLIHDQCRIQLLLSIAATGKMLVVRQHAARLLCKLTALCYEQTGSFSLVKRPIFKVFCSVFFSSSIGQLLIPTESLREAIEEMRQCSLAEENATQAFLIQYKELLNGLITQIKVFEMWQVAIASPEQLRDYEEIEEGLYRIMRAISPFWLLDEKKLWLDALLSLHVTRKKFAEAACCKLECIEFTRQIVQEEEQSEFLFWQVRELVLARELAEKAEWLEQQVSNSEQLLVCLKEQRRYPEYIETLRYLERAICQHAEAEAGGAGCGNSHAFYRVTYAGDCVSTYISKHEYIYKRNKFMSLGEFVGEMKAMLRVKYPMSERVDVVPEAKPLIGDDQPNVIFMRVTTVEEVKKSDNKQPHVELVVASGGGCNSGVSTMMFKFAMPFTLGSSSYGKTSEQMKRITFLTVAQQFPCALNRQVVIERREEIRCPIDNSMDDIQKRCLLLQDEITKEVCGRTDLKTLTLVLKGSVDTHVHGGIPEVVESFLASKAEPNAAQEQTDDENHEHGVPTNFPPLLDARGAVLNLDESLQKRHQLANLLVHFLKLCWQCLLISREAFRRASSQSSISVFSTAASSPYLPLSSESVGLLSSSTFHGVSTSFAPSGTAAAQANVSSTKAPGMSTNGFLSLFLPNDDITITMQLSPLQLEFERSFVLLVELVQRKISFPFESAGDVAQLQQQVKRIGPVAQTGPSAGVASNGS